MSIPEVTTLDDDEEFFLYIAEYKMDIFYPTTLQWSRWMDVHKN